MTGLLTELQQKAAMKPALEVKLRELQGQRREYDREEFFFVTTGQGNGILKLTSRKEEAYATGSVFW